MPKADEQYDIVYDPVNTKIALAMKKSQQKQDSFRKEDLTPPSSKNEMVIVGLTSPLWLPLALTAGVMVLPISWCNGASYYWYSCD